MEKLEKIKSALVFIKLARRLGYPVYHAILSSDVAKRKIIKPLEETAGWNEDDERRVNEMAEEIKKAMPSKGTMEEKIETIESIISDKK